MSLARRLDVIEQQLSEARAADLTVPSWAAALDPEEMTPDTVYAAWGAVLEAIAAGRCFVYLPGMLHARRLMVDFTRPGASQQVCSDLRDWCDYINLLWDNDRYPLDTKPATLAEYAAFITEMRPYMSFASMLSDDDRARLEAVADAGEPDPPDIEARFVAWCESAGITL